MIGAVAVHKKYSTRFLVLIYYCSPVLMYVVLVVASTSRETQREKIGLKLF